MGNTSKSDILEKRSQKGCYNNFCGTKSKEKGFEIDSNKPIPEVPENLNNSDEIEYEKNESASSPKTFEFLSGKKDNQNSLYASPEKLKNSSSQFNKESILKYIDITKKLRTNPSSSHIKWRPNSPNITQSDYSRKNHDKNILNSISNHQTLLDGFLEIYTKEIDDSFNSKYCILTKTEFKVCDRYKDNKYVAFLRIPIHKIRTIVKPIISTLYEDQIKHPELYNLFEILLKTPNPFYATPMNSKANTSFHSNEAFTSFAKTPSNTESPSKISSKMNLIENPRIIFRAKSNELLVKWMTTLSLLINNPN